MINNLKSPRMLDLLALLSGLAMPLAFAPYGLYPLALILPTILLLCWQQASPRRAWLRGYLFGLGMFGFGLHWLHVSIAMFGGSGLLFAWATTLLLAAVLSIYPALIGWLLNRFFAHASLAGRLLLAVPGLWVTAEWIRSWLFSGFPWLSLGYSQIDSVLGGYAPVLGVFGVSLVVILCSSLLAFSILARQRSQRITAIAGIFVLCFTGALLQKINWSAPNGHSIRVAMIQGAVEQEVKWLPEQLQQTMRLYHDLSKPYWGKVDLIVWPETAIPAFDFQLDSYLDEQRRLARASDTLLILGLATGDIGSREYRNSMLSLGIHEDIYHKRHLVPFGEYLPLKFILDPLLKFLHIPMSDFTPGDAKKPLLELNEYQLGVSICYEAVFGHEVIQALPEADILVNVSNDAWFGDSIGPHQHLQIARMRALESSRYMLRSTNTGITAIIDANGKIVEQLPQFVPDALMAEVKLYTGVTQYAVSGNYPIIILCLLMLLVITAIRINTRSP